MTWVQVHHVDLSRGLRERCECPPLSAREGVRGRLWMLVSPREGRLVLACPGCLVCDVTDGPPEGAAIPALTTA